LCGTADEVEPLHLTAESERFLRVDLRFPRDRIENLPLGECANCRELPPEERLKRAKAAFSELVDAMIAADTDARLIEYRSKPSPTRRRSSMNSGGIRRHTNGDCA
jgi:hypothetical protein